MQIIAGTHRGRKILAPKGKLTRPTSSRLREALFNIAQHYIDGAFFLDLFAGSGAMGLEALSRGAAQAVFVDQSGEAIKCIQQNLQQLDLEALARVMQGEVFRQMEKLVKQNTSFNLIYADAPYKVSDSVSEKLLLFLDNSTLLKDGGLLFIEDTLKSIPHKLSQLTLIDERRSGPAYLHQYKMVYK